MEIGSGVAIAGISFSAVAVLYRMLPPRKTEADKRADLRGEEGANERRHCQDHSGLCASVSGLERWLKDIHDDVKSLLQR